MASKSTVADFYTDHYKIPLIVSSDLSFSPRGTQGGGNIVEVLVDSQVYAADHTEYLPIPSGVPPRLFPQYTDPYLLTTGYLPAPRSELSPHGVDLVHKAWSRVDFNGPLLADPMVAFNLTHNTDFSMASHGNEAEAHDLSEISVQITCLNQTASNILHCAQWLCGPANELFH